MDAIRSKQIYEALNYDQIANAMVFNLEKKRTATIEEESSIPNSQIDAEILKQTNRNVQALLVALQSKHANLSSMVRPGSSVDSEDFKKWCERHRRSRIATASIQSHCQTVFSSRVCQQNHSTDIGAIPQLAQSGFQNCGWTQNRNQRIG